MSTTTRLACGSAIERPDTDRANLGAVYTPDFLADWVCAEASRFSELKEPVVYDPACGDGSLLRASARHFPPISKFIGTDLSPVALNQAQEYSNENDRNFTLKLGNSLDIAESDLSDVDVCVMNPPWGARLSALSLSKTQYELFGGRHDSWETFLEWSIKRLRDGCIVAAILPGSFTQAQKAEIRRLLDNGSEMLLQADLGEGIFPHVYRSVIVIVFRVSRSPRNNTTTYLRLSHESKRDVLKGVVSLQDALELDPRQPLRSSVSLQQEPSPSWMDTLIYTRGVELGSKGLVEKCDNCGFHRPKSRNRIACRRCNTDHFTLVTAIGDQTNPNTVPLILGRDVQRFRVSPSKWLTLGLEGINYKDPEQYKSPKLLVRKTGLALNAAVDESDSFTNQVVYSFTQLPGTPPWQLYFYLAVLMSDALLAYHLNRTGDSQWRSHPYITPSALRTYPVPVPGVSCTPKQAQPVAELARQLNCETLSPSKQESALACLNREVNLILNLNLKDEEWIRTTLSETQKIRAFRRSLAS